MDAPSPSDAELRTRIRQQEVLADLGQRALDPDDLDRLIHDAAAMVAETLDAEYCGVFELRPGGDEALLREGVGWPEALVGRTTVPADRNSRAGHALRSADPLVVDDLRADERYAADPLAERDVASAVSAGIGSVDAPWGVLEAYAIDREAFTEHDATFVRNVANVLASAVESKRTRSELEEIYGRISDGFLAVDEEWRLTYLNDRAHELINPEGRTLVGQEVWEALPDGARRSFEPECERAMYRQETVTFEAHLPDPLDAWFEVQAYPSETGLSVYFRDVTERKRVHRRLAEERDMFAQGPAVVFRWRNEEGWPVEYVSENVTDVFGYEPAELESGEVPYTDLLLEEELDRIAREVEQNSDGTTERFSHDPYRVETKDGDVRWVEDTTKIIRDETGEITHYLGYLVDITERRERERELARYEAIVETMNDGIYVKDEDGRFTMVNEAYAELTGYDREELLGAPASMVVDEAVVERAKERYAASGGDGEPTMEAAIHTAEGDRVPTEGTFATMWTPDGERRQVGVVRDITERKERERDLAETIVELQESEERLQLALEAGEMGTWELDLRTQDSPNRSPQHDRIFGYEEPREDWDFETFLDHVRPADREQVRRRFEEALDRGTWEFECWITRADGERRAISAQGEFHFDEEGEPDRAVGVVQDVTERKERERELRRKERRFEAVFEDPNILVGLLEPDGTVLDINRTAMEYIDADLQEVTGEPFWETPWWGEGDDVTADVRRWVERAAAGEYVDFEADLTRPDGERYVINGVFRPVTDDDGDVVSVIVSDRDVTRRREYERALEESEQRYRTLAESFPNGIVTLFDENLRYTLAAGRAFEDLPVDPDDLRGHTPREAWGDDVADVLEPLFRSTLDGRTDAVELSYVGREWIIRAVPITDEEGTVFAGMTMAQDVTERKERERRLEESEQRYRTLVDNFPDGSVGLFDEDLRYIAVGGELLDTFDLEAEGRIGRRIQDIYPEGIVEEVEPYFHAALDGEANDFEIEYRGRHLDAHALPVRNDAGEVFAGMVVVRDVTDRREAQRALAESEARFRMLAENVDQIVWMATADAEEWIYVNPAFEDIWGMDREKLYADPMSFLDAVHPDDRERLREAFAALPEEPFDEEYRVVRPDGEVRWIHSRGARVRDEDTGMVRTVGVGNDVTERKERERALAESEQRYRTFIQHFPNGAVALVDEEIRYRTVGGNPLDVADVTADEIEGRPVEDTLPPALADELVPRYEAAIEGKSSTFETEFDGRVYQFQVVPVRDDDDDVFAALGMSQDITERLEAQRQLEESERRYRTLAEHFPNGAVAIYDHDLRYTLAEGVALGDTLPTAAELEGDRMPELFPPDTVADLEPLFRTAVEEGEIDSTTTEFDGRHWRVWAAPLRDAADEIFAGLSFAQDITEQVEREAELERALDLLNKTERIADVAGWEVDPETGEPYWSDHLFDLLDVDYEEQPTLDQALDVYHTPEDRATVENAVEEALETGDPFDVEARFPRPEGDVGWLRIQGDPEVADGEVVTLRGAVQDVTERKRREKRLEDLVDELGESNERLEQFAYAASHDLQEPLRMVSSYLQLIERRYADALDEDGREFLAYAVDGADRMREMIDGLLEYSRVDTRGDPFEPVDLDAVLADVRENLHVKIEESGAEITTDDLPRVEGDGGQLRQVFQNLLDNAIEYSGDDPPRVHVSAERVGERWAIAVSDEGIGIDPEDADRIFEVFQRLHAPDEHDGTGIGLALVERIIERHGGEIRVDSEPGEGATFRFTLPAAGDGDE